MNPYPSPLFRDIASKIENDGMQCRCDLDNWQPTAETGHTTVCPIHAAAKAANHIQPSAPPPSGEASCVAPLTVGDGVAPLTEHPAGAGGDTANSEMIRLSDALAAETRENAQLRQQLAAAEKLSVTHLMLDVVPGDGDGLEVYAKSIEDVEDAFAENYQKIDDLEQSLATERAAREKAEMERNCAMQDYDTAKTELAAAKAAAAIPCCDVCGGPYTEESPDGHLHQCHTLGCPRCDDGHWYSGVSYVTPAKELAVRLGKALRIVMDQLAAAKAEVAGIADFQDEIRGIAIAACESVGIHEECDGSGCDSGDWRDLTRAEVRLGFNAITERLQERSAELAAAVAKGGAFKAFVHHRLDEMGIPTHPDGPHSKEGCRVGDRLDILQAQRDDAVRREKELAPEYIECRKAIGGQLTETQAELAAAKAEVERMSGELEGASRMAKHYVRERQAARADAQLERERAEACELAAYEMVKKAEADAERLRGLLREAYGYTTSDTGNLPERIKAALAADGASNPQSPPGGAAAPVRAVVGRQSEDA